MSSLIQQLGIRYWFRVLLTVLFCISTVWFGIHQSYGWLGVSLCLLVLSIIWQIRLYQLHTKQVPKKTVLPKAKRSTGHSTGWDISYIM